MSVHDTCVYDTSASSIAMDTSSGVDLQHLPGSTPDKYALNLMDALFTDEEMRGHLFIKSGRSKSVRDRLPQDRVKQLLCK